MASRAVHSAPEPLARLAARIEGRRPQWGGGCVEVKRLGVCVENLAGIAAGFDKDAKLAWVAWALGAGFHVVGSVLPHPHKGAERKVMARLGGEATVNRLGLPSEGAARVAGRLSKRRPPGMPVAANVASLTLDGYASVTEALAPVVDWFEVNVSCPNVEEHRRMEEPDLAREACRRAAEAAGGRPVLLKIPPVTGRDEAWTYADVARECGAAGVVAANTLRVQYKGVNAGLGGAPLYPIVKSMVKWLGERLPSGSVIVAVGGVDSGEKAVELLSLGASLVEVITALFLHGPARFRSIATATRAWAMRNL
ncbi:beta/alpha barrel domain-containing protein [Stetteria hydrogenophila]